MYNNNNNDDDDDDDDDDSSKTKILHNIALNTKSVFFFLKD